MTVLQFELQFVDYQKFYLEFLYSDFYDISGGYSDNYGDCSDKGVENLAKAAWEVLNKIIPISSDRPKLIIFGYYKNYIYYKFDPPYEI